MLRIRRGPPPQQTGDAVDYLTDCHGRIREFTALATRLSRSYGEAPIVIADAAASVSRYFEVALPLHEADEEESVAPRLAGRAPELDAVLAEIRAQHDEMHDTVRGLVEICTELADDPTRLPDHADRLGTLAEQLAEIWSRHLSIEEEIVFPAIRQLLSDEERNALALEMPRRRGQ